MDYKIFDGHNDVLFRLFLKNKPDSYLDFIDGDKEGHLDLPRMNQANFKGGLCAYMFLPQNKISLTLISWSTIKIWSKMNIYCLLYTSPSPRD